MRAPKILATALAFAVIGGGAAGAAPSEPPRTLCDQLATDPLSQEGIAAQVEPHEIDGKKAVFACQSALKQHPGTSRFHHMLGRAYLASGELQKAFAEFRTAAEAGYGAAQMTLVMFLGTRLGTSLGENDPEEALKWARALEAQGHFMALAALDMIGAKPLQATPAVPSDPVLVALMSRAGGGEPQAMMELARRYADGDGVAKSLGLAREWYKQAAEKGHAAGQFQFAEMLTGGLGGPKDAPAALQWYQKAAAQGHHPAQYKLGLIYVRGLGVERDRNVAFQWFLFAAEAGHAQAQVKMGLYYEYGRVVRQNRQTALEWYAKAVASGSEEAKSYLASLKELVRLHEEAEAGDADAQYQLSTRYQSGKDVNRDRVKAVAYLRQAADQGYVEAMNALAIRFNIGMGVAKDEAEAVGWFRKTAEQGHAGAQLSLGNAYLYGAGIEKDVEEAEKWYLLSLAQGNARAAYNLAIVYRWHKGEENNLSTTLSYYRKAAELGHASAKDRIPGVERLIEKERAEREVAPIRATELEELTARAEAGDAKAQTALAGRYRFATHGEQNFEKAAHWYRRAAEQGDADAQAGLANFYAAGTGVAKDYAKALEWARESAAQGNPHGEHHLALHLFYGWGTEIDLVEAEKLMGSASSSGLGYIVSNRNNITSIVANNIEQAADPEWLRAWAERGSTTAQVIIARLLLKGDGVKADTEAALAWLLKAAEAGDPDAQYRLAFAYAKGQGTIRQRLEAPKWYEQAALQGHKLAAFNLGSKLWYGYGIGFDKDRATAVKWLTQAGEAGVGEAQYMMGRAWEAGEGVPDTGTPQERSDNAAGWYNWAAQQGHADAQYRLALIMAEAGLKGEKRLPYADKLIRDAAAQDHLLAQVTLAQWLERGTLGKKDPGEAETWYRLAAKQGHEDAARALLRLERRGETPEETAERYRREFASGQLAAAYNLARLHTTGDGVPNNPEKALALYRKAAEKGHAPAALELGRFYEDGTGVARNDTTATAWYRVAAEAGSADGQFRYASRLIRGKGTPRDLEQAYFWMSVADEKDHKNAWSAKSRIKRLASRRDPIEPARLKEIDAAARQWTPTLEAIATAVAEALTVKEINAGTPGLDPKDRPTRPPRDDGRTPTR